MAEAEDVITDVARHATSYTQALWRRHQQKTQRPSVTMLADVAPRIDLLIQAVFGTRYRLRTAQLPAPPTFLAQTFQRHERPRTRCAIPATDGVCIWLPADSGLADPTLATERFRTMALLQAMRAQRGSAAGMAFTASPLVRDLYLVLEAHAADADLARLLPGMQTALNDLRQASLAARPPLSSFPALRRPLENWLRSLLAQRCDGNASRVPASLSPQESARIARAIAAELTPDPLAGKRLGERPLWRDWWTGELRLPTACVGATLPAHGAAGDDAAGPTRTARLIRRPEVREGDGEEDNAGQGAWMIQPEPPQEHAEDPFGMQRPTDRDVQTAADEFADLMSELAQARLVSSPGVPREVLLSDDPPDARARFAAGASGDSGSLSYPEWDFRIQAYRHPGATVRLLPPASGPQQWVDDTMNAHRSLLDAIGRRFAMLRARRRLLRRQFDGDELDLEACIDSQADMRCGLPTAQALYCSQRRTRRDTAILLLIDVSGSTDGWISANRRVIDVEREALLLVCIALNAVGLPYAVQAFSGCGPQRVTVRELKRFDEAWNPGIALRIAALAPEQYTRAGAALRHASRTLMQEVASHRLLLLLSDGKPNDEDLYQGRYGVEDTRRAVTEAKLQGISPFCLTVDRQASAYVPAVFGAQHYALLTNPGRLPGVLLDWMQRLLLA
jgi:nitric oxide reductase NorD protein